MTSFDYNEIACEQAETLPASGHASCGKLFEGKKVNLNPTHPKSSRVRAICGRGCGFGSGGQKSRCGSHIRVVFRRSNHPRGRCALSSNSSKAAFQLDSTHFQSPVTGPGTWAGTPGDGVRGSPDILHPVCSWAGLQDGACEETIRICCPARISVVHRGLHTTPT